MEHQIHRVRSFEHAGPFTLRVRFEDGSEQVIDLGEVVGHGIFGPLADPGFFERVVLDRESGTLTWPNGADFDPAMLHDWPRVGPQMETLVRSWGSKRASA